MSIDLYAVLHENNNCFTKKNKDNIPTTSGVYGWFYPLKLPPKNSIQHDLKKFIKEMQLVYNYDAMCEGVPVKELTSKLNWENVKIKIELELTDKSSEDEENKRREFIENCTDDEYLQFQIIMMKSSLLLPPLYIGKAKNLYERYKEHLSNSQFKTRYSKYADINKLKPINDLIFMCYKTNSISREDKPESEIIIENLLMQIIRPRYSKK
jgi:hypothetical protein